MGLDTQSLRFLLRCRDTVSFDRTLMLGRQASHLGLDELRNVLSGSGFPAAGVESTVAAMSKTQFIEPVLQLLGAHTPESLDYSDFEQATITHDLNAPIADSLKEKFTCVIDGGTLEHVFNFPQAIRNAMEMVSVGGHFIGIAPANNLPGHGFYQFSPELYYRVLSPSNGYAVEEMIICETYRDAAFYRVSDPDALGSRVEFMNDWPAYLLVKAKRVSRAEIFAKTPQQSDYVAIWSREEDATGAGPRREGLGSRLKRLVPDSVKNMVRPYVPRLHPFRSPAFKRCG